jgi:3'-phosphoadenosine 5'-phosphosulfate sulfotransferase (PAPS reductase)/FAD synthetase
MRSPEELLESGLQVIERAFRETRAWKMIPLFSGGHDSYCACYIASQHPMFKGVVYHIDTGIGSLKTKQFVERVCREERWELRVYKASSYNLKNSYEFIIRMIGFPGPAQHLACYIRLKERCINYMARNIRRDKRKYVLVTGMRSQESKRRAVYENVAFRVGTVSKKDPTKVRQLNYVWTSPCHDWSASEQRSFMDSYGLLLNPIKISPLGMSGECFCGAFATPQEYELIKEYCPDVATEIERLASIARECGKNDKWGYAARRELKTIKVSPTGPMCSSCDRRSRQSGIVIRDEDNILE